MQEWALWTIGIVSGMTVLGASAGSAFLLTGALAGANAAAVVAAMLFATVFLASGLSMQLYRRGLDHSVLVGGVSGALAIFSFFSVPTAVSAWTGDALDRTALLVALLVLPLLAGAFSAGGTLYLSRGVERYRATHGLVHAPK